MRKPILISKKEDLDWLLSLRDTDIHQDSLKNLFATYEDQPAKFSPQDTFKFSTEKFLKISDPLRINKNLKAEFIQTNLGRYIFNIFMNDFTNPYFFRICGYVNEPLTVKAIDAFSEQMSDALLVDQITSEEYIDFLNRREWLGYIIVIFMTPSLGYSMLSTNKEITKKRDQLIKLHQKELQDPELGLFAALAIEKEVLTFARTIFKDDVAMDIYKSGARGSFENNYKNTAVMRGAMLKFDDNTKYKISTSSLAEGIPKEDIVFYNDLFVIGTAGRAKDTQKGGYLSKQLSSAFQNLMLDKEGSDCKTSDYIEVVIDRPKEFLLRYVIENGKLVLLTPDIVDTYKGKKVKMRSPMYCKTPLICNKCAGDLYYKLGIQNFGLTSNAIGTSLLNLSMKLFHDTTLKSTKIVIDDYISD
jgi:hypothetical protein